MRGRKSADVANGGIGSLWPHTSSIYFVNCDRS